METAPNILLITSDQQHWNTLGRHFPEIKTPNLDRLAAEGIDFRRAYCPNPTCTPTRASLITGQPGTIPQGVVSRALQSLVDIPVTFLRQTGLGIPSPMQGKDQSAVWKGEAESARTHLTVEHHHQPTAVHLRTLGTEDYKLTVYFNREYGELYDLKNDPGEIQNLWSRPAHAALRERLLKELLFAEMEGDYLFMPRIAGA